MGITLGTTTVFYSVPPPCLPFRFGYNLTKQAQRAIIDIQKKPFPNCGMWVDELWSFVYKKENKVWIWIALCRQTRQIVSRAIGDRSKETCQIFWDGIPEAYRSGHCFSDFWDAYHAIFIEEQLTQIGKEAGETAHVERWNRTLRQRLGRFVRKTLSFSKLTRMHTLCLDLFLHRYNLERAILLG